MRVPAETGSIRVGVRRSRGGGVQDRYRARRRTATLDVRHDRPRRRARSGHHALVRGDRAAADRQGHRRGRIFGRSTISASRLRRRGRRTALGASALHVRLLQQAVVPEPATWALDAPRFRIDCAAMPTARAAEAARRAF
ncbi:hypothetical protein AB5I41_19920 [Sphingomonas sp. MMS24-JH45]